MKTLLLALTFLASFTLSAQEVTPGRRGGAGGDATWNLSWGKKTLLKAKGEDETANVVTLRRSELSKKNTLILTFNGGTSEGWARTITVSGANDAELLQRKGNTLTLSHTALARLAKGRKELQLWTMALPTDPKVAATVRVRRVHLVTIRVK